MMPFTRTLPERTSSRGVGVTAMASRTHAMPVVVVVVFAVVVRRVVSSPSPSANNPP
jgi:hypothetical protein